MLDLTFFRYDPVDKSDRYESIRYELEETVREQIVSSYFVHGYKTSKQANEYLMRGVIEGDGEGERGWKEMGREREVGVE